MAKATLKQANTVKITSRNLRQGKCEKCAFCNKVKTLPHRKTYDYPSKIVWLCRLHHKLFKDINMITGEE